MTDTPDPGAAPRLVSVPDSGAGPDMPDGPDALAVGEPPEAGLRRPAISQSAVATGRGDDGTTGLLYGGRVPKDDPRTEAYGSVDEAVAALGLARAELGAMAATGQLPAGLVSLPRLILDLQRQLFVAGAELAANPDARDRLRDGVSRVDEAMLLATEEELARIETATPMPREFVVPGESRLSAALEVARTTLRRAERRVITLQREGSPSGPWLVPWLNRVADLLWVLARAAEQAEQRATTLVRPEPGTGPR